MKAPVPERFFLLDQEPKTRAVITDNRTLNFEELKENVLAISFSLREKGILNGSYIGIIASGSPEYFFNVLALWQLGAVAVPLNVRLPKSELLNQLKYARCKFVLTNSESEFNIDDSSIEIIKFPSVQSNHKLAVETREISLNESAAVIFTSGSGLIPKGVELTFNSFYQSAFYSNKLLRYSYSDKLLVSLPLYHIGGFSILTRALLWGVPLIFPESLSADNLAASINNHHPTIISLVAAQLKELIDKGISPNTELKNSLLGGGFSDTGLVATAIESGWPINIVYGSTETASFVTALLTEEFNIKQNSVGRPVPPVNIFIQDENATELKPYEVGEIVILTPALMKRYIGTTDNAGNVNNRVYYSGDLGYLDEEGYLYVTGRKDNIISTGGEKVNPAEVESALLEHPQIADAVVFPIKDNKWGEIVAAAVVKKNETEELNYLELKTFLEKRVTGFKIPKKIFFEKSLPKTELGKVQRNKLGDYYKL